MIFSAYDVLDGEELHIDRVMFDGKLVTLPTPVLTDGRILYTIDCEVNKNTLLRIEKDTYFPFISYYSLNVTSIFDERQVIDLGRIGLLNEIREDALILTWQDRPVDLDSRLLCPNGQVVGIKQDINATELRENYFAKVSVDNKIGRGPETITISHWVNFDTKNKIGGHFRFYVNWFRDENNS